MSDLFRNILIVSEAAQIIGVTPRQVQRLCKAKKLTCRVVDGGVYIVLRDSVEAYKQAKSK